MLQQADLPAVFAAHWHSHSSSTRTSLVGYTDMRKITVKVRGCLKAAVLTIVVHAPPRSSKSNVGTEESRHETHH